MPISDPSKTIRLRPVDRVRIVAREETRAGFGRRLGPSEPRLRNLSHSATIVFGKDEAGLSLEARPLRWRHETLEPSCRPLVDRTCGVEDYGDHISYLTRRSVFLHWTIVVSRDVVSLQASRVLVPLASHPSRLRRRWTPPAFTRSEAAAGELRELTIRLAVSRIVMSR